MTAAHHPVHFASSGQIWFGILLLMIVAVMCLAVTWGREDDQQRRDVEGVDERRRMNQAFSKDRPR